MRLLKRILQIATDEDSIVLDSFAGSGTTAQAVLALNREDGGDRRFILIECEDYVDSITAERVRRVIRGVPSAKDESLKAGLGGGFSYFRLGAPLRRESLLDPAKGHDTRPLPRPYLLVRRTRGGSVWRRGRPQRRRINVADGQIALVEGMSIATRDTGGFDASGAPLVNPWEAPAAHAEE